MSGDYKYLVGEATFGDANESNPRGAYEGQGLTDALHGKYYELNKRGRVYVAATAGAGVVPPIFSATAQKFVLWNMAASGVNIELIKLCLGQVGTPTVPFDFGIAPIVGAGTALATAAPISAFTETAPINMKTFIAAKGSAAFSVAATVVAPTLFFTLGISQIGVLAAASATTPWTTMIHDFDGTVIIAPGNAICICTGFAGTCPAMTISLKYAEVPTA
jgi:hypothetical protein